MTLFKQHFSVVGLIVFTVFSYALNISRSGDYVDNVKFFGDNIVSKSTKNRLALWQPDSTRRDVSACLAFACMLLFLTYPFVWCKYDAAVAVFTVNYCTFPSS